MTPDAPRTLTPELRAGMALAAALEAAHYGGDSGEDVDRLVAELGKRGYVVREATPADSLDALRAELFSKVAAIRDAIPSTETTARAVIGEVLSIIEKED
jgi:hypothetical protein